MTTTKRQFLRAFAEGDWDEGLAWHEGQHQWLTTVQMRSVKWLWNGFIPRGMVTVLTGEEGLGKSQLMLKIASRFTQGFWGDEHPDGRGPGGLVKFYTAEDPLRYVLKPRLVANQANLSNVATEGIQSKFTLTEEGISEMARGVLEVGFGLIVIDPIIAYFGARSDANKAQDVRDVMRKLSALAEDTDCVIVGIAHPKKGEEAQALHKMIGGSSAFGQAARSVLGVAQHPSNEDQRIVGRLKGNLSKAPTPIVYEIVSQTLPKAGEDGEDVLTSRVEVRGEWEGDQKQFEAAILRKDPGRGDDDEPGALTKTEQVKVEIRELLGVGGKMRRADLKRLAGANTGHSAGTVENAIKQMIKETELKSGPREDLGATLVLLDPDHPDQ